MAGKILPVILLFLTSTFAVLADNGKVETIGPFTNSSASEPLRKALEAKGYRVSLSDGTVLCEIWLRSGIAKGKNDAQGATYTWLSESTLVGVVTFPKASTDFRKQAIKAGTYTLRYELHPIDGNHMGISPIRDFLLLVPLAIDQNPDARYKFEEVVAFSKKASGTNHPNTISMVSPEGISTWPSVIEDEYGHLVFAAKLKNASGAETPIAFVVKGVAEQ